MLTKVAGKVIKFVLKQQPGTKSYQLAWELSNLRRWPPADGSVFSLIHILQFTGYIDPADTSQAWPIP